MSNSASFRDRSARLISVLFRQLTPGHSWRDPTRWLLLSVGWLFVSAILTLGTSGEMARSIFSVAGLMGLGMLLLVPVALGIRSAVRVARIFVAALRRERRAATIEGVRVGAMSTVLLARYLGAMAVLSLAILAGLISAAIGVVGIWDSLGWPSPAGVYDRERTKFQALLDAPLSMSAIIATVVAVVLVLIVPRMTVAAAAAILKGIGALYAQAHRALTAASTDTRRR